MTPVMLPELSLHVAGTAFSNAKGGNRRFEILLCIPGERVHLVREPRNRHDPRAVAVFSARHIQIGYLTAERCGLVGARIDRGDDVRAIFQQTLPGGGAAIRVNLSGQEPTLPRPDTAPAEPPPFDPDIFYPDDLPPDD